MDNLKILEQMSDENVLCNYCEYSLDCIGEITSSYSGDPIFPPCSDLDYAEKFIDIEEYLRDKIKEYRYDFEWIINDGGEPRLQVFVYCSEDNYVDWINCFSADNYKQAIEWLVEENDIMNKELTIPNITDLSKLKVIKANKNQYWNLIFEYDGIQYMIHGKREDYEDFQELYIREVNNTGNYDLIFITNVYGGEHVLSEYFNLSKPIVYDKINKEKFAYLLTKNKLATGIMQSTVDLYTDTLSIYKRKIQESEKIKNEFMRKNRKRWENCNE